MDHETRRTIERLIEAVQKDLDHLSGEAANNAKMFNATQTFVEDTVNDLQIRMDGLEERIVALEP